MPESKHQEADVVIRGLFRKDTNELIEMIEQSPSDFDEGKFRMWMSTMFGALGGKPTRVFVAEDVDGKLQGYVAYEIFKEGARNRFFMHDCFVREERRRMGIGTKLLYGMISGGPMQAIRLKIAEVVPFLEAPSTMPKWTTTDALIEDDNKMALAFLTNRRFRNNGNTEDNKIKLTFAGDGDE